MQAFHVQISLNCFLISSESWKSYFSKWNDFFIILFLFGDFFPKYMHFGRKSGAILVLGGIILIPLLFYDISKNNPVLLI